MCACGQNRAQTAQNYQVPMNTAIPNQIDGTVQALLQQQQAQQANQIDLQQQMLKMQQSSQQKVYR